MRYYLHHMGQTETPTVADSERPAERIRAPEIELLVNPTVKLAEIKSDPDLIHRSLEQALDDLVAQVKASVYNFAEDGRDATILFIRTNPCALAADEPPHAIYDQPLDWDEENHEIIVPEGANIIGHTDPALGWTLFTTIALMSQKAEDLSDHEWQTFDHLPLWRRPLPTHTREHLRTAQARHQFARSVGQCLGFGHKPEDAHWVG